MRTLLPRIVLVALSSLLPASSGSLTAQVASPAGADWAAQRPSPTERDWRAPGLVLVEALRARDAGRADSLETAWRAALRRDPGDRVVQLGLAGLARVTARYAEADSILDSLGARGLQPAGEGRAPLPDPVTLWAAAELAEGLRMRGRFRDSFPLFEAADHWARQLEIPALEGRTALGLAAWYARSEGGSAAGPHLDRLDALGERADPWIRAIMTCQVARALPGRAEEIRVEVEAAAAAAQGEGFPHLAADCQSVLHQRFLQEGNADSALAVMRRMEGLSRRAGDPITLSTVLERQASAHMNVGAFGMATLAAVESVDLGRTGGNLSAAAWALLHLGNISRATGALDDALGHLSEAGALFREQGDETGVLVAERRRAQVDGVAGRHAAATRRLEELRPRIAEVMGPGDNAFVLLDLLDLAVAGGEMARADSLLPVVRDALAATGNSGWVPGLAWREFAVALAMDDLPRARDAAAASLAVASVPTARYLALGDLARLRLREGDVDGATRALEEGLDTLMEWRASVPVERLRVSAFALARGFDSNPSGTTAPVVAALVAKGELERAFTLVERQRARSLLERVLRSEAFSQGAPASPLLDPTATPRAAAEVRKALPRGTAALLTVTGASGEPSTAFLLTADTLLAFPLPAAGVMSPPLERFASALRSGVWLDTPAHELAGMVARPLVEALPQGITTLVWVPDGPLHALPLDALPHPDGGRLLDRFAVSQAPSLSVLVALLERDPVEGGRVVALADPGGSHDGSGVGLAGRAMAGGGSAGGAVAGLRRVLGADLLPPLPGSRREATRVARFGAPGLVLRGEEASETALREMAARGGVGVLHLASHALVDPDSPGRTALVLAPGGGEDGLVTPDELGTLALQANLVVLSACTTAGGLNLRGEGIQGLVAPLLGGGARVVMATGWEIPDAMPVPLMEGFYRRLAEGLPVAEALRQAKQEAIAAGASPGVWAAFQLHGDPGVRPVLRARPSLGLPGSGAISLALLVAAILALAGVLFRARRAASPP